jgi:2-octaprenyl-6-methoxyphenol hydroxylase
MAEFDLLIVGGGMVGASLAIALRESALKIALVEAYPLSTDSQPSYDDRGIAISYGSQRIFETMGLWPAISQFATPIKHIHVSDRGRFGVTRLSAETEQVPALGQVITARAFGHQLNKQLQQQANLNILCPAQVTNLEQQQSHIDLNLNNGDHYRAKLVVAADGKDSTIRQLLGMGTWQQQYQQTAVTANITTDKSHQNWAYERFTDTGPMALLPMSENRSSLVWTVKSGEETDLLESTDEEFLQRLQQRFGYRAGRFIRVGQRHSHALTLMQADMPVQNRIVFIGNAAHSLHPIAGQGFNLGLRDVAVLADLIHDETEDCGDMRTLHTYQQWRQQDQDQVVKATDKLVKLFSNNITLLGHFRGAGLAMMDNLPLAKSWLAQKSMGLGQKQPRLGRGLNL